MDKTCYHWEGINRIGARVRGFIEAGSPAIAKAELAKQGVVSKKIRKKRGAFFTKKITQSNLAFFSRQVALMLKAGIPLIQSFDLVASSQTNPLMKRLIETIKQDVETGLTFSEALGNHPVFFNALVCGLVDAGEKSGKLELMLDKLADYQEKIEAVKKKIKKAMAYPFAVLLIACMVTFALLTAVVPQFESLFQSFGADLPGFTRTIISLSSFFKQYWPVFFILVAGLGCGFKVAQKRSPLVSQSIDRILLKLPILGPVVKGAIIARFSRTLAITVAAGLPLVDALAGVAGVTGNSVYAKAVKKTGEKIAEGQLMQTALGNTRLFPDLVIQMVALGEESGSLETMLARAADFYEEEVDNAVDTLISLLEPVIMAIVGILTGGLVIAMYLPLFKLGSAV